MTCFLFLFESFHIPFIYYRDFCEFLRTGAGRQGCKEVSVPVRLGPQVDDAESVRWSVGVSSCALVVDQKGRGRTSGPQPLKLKLFWVLLGSLKVGFKAERDGIGFLSFCRQALDFDMLRSCEPVGDSFAFGSVPPACWYRPQALTCPSVDAPGRDVKGCNCKAGKQLEDVDSGGQGT